MNNYIKTTLIVLTATVCILLQIIYNTITLLPDTNNICTNNEFEDTLYLVYDDLTEGTVIGY